MSALTQDQRVAAARKAYTAMDLRHDYPSEYQQGINAREQGVRLADCPFPLVTFRSMAWLEGWRQAMKDEGS